MRLHFVPVTVEAFLAEWFPPPAGVSDESIPDFQGAFKTMVANVAEEQMYKAFIKCVEARGLCPNLTLRETPHRAESSDPKGIKVDLCIFEENHVYGAGKENTQDWGNQVMHGEFKNLKGATGGDPFDDTRSTPPLNDDDPFFESAAISRRDARGQIVSYAAELALRQHRVFFFTFMILGFEARLIRWDRAGTIVTNRFNYQTRPELAIFLWRFSQSPLKRGYDPTATRIPFDNPLVKEAIRNQLDERKDYVRKMFENDVREGWPLYRLTVGRPGTPSVTSGVLGQGTLSTTIDGQGPSTTTVKQFIVGRPHFRDGGIVGRATRGYVALDVETKEFVWLKDVWRIDGLHKEGDVIQEMNDANIPHVPTLICHGDVENQVTVTNTRWPDSDEDTPNPTPNPMRRFTHYRLVVKEVGRPLAEFENGRELVGILSDCLHAHQDVYEKLSILHRDVSDGNILIVPGSGRDEGEMFANRGMLNDWDLCKKISKGEEGAGSVLARALDRTGTWAFMSAALLRDGKKPAVLQDDLESFFHVLLFNAVKFLKNSCQDIPGFITDFFESYTLTKDRCLGGRGKYDAFEHNKLQYPVDEPPWTFDSHPLKSLTTTILSWFHNHYKVQEARKEALLAKQSDNSLQPNAVAQPFFILPEEEVEADEINAITLAFAEKRAVFVASHHHVRAAFVKCRGMEGWSDEKVADQSVTKTTKYGRGVKRGSQYTIGDGSPTSKLSKTSQSVFSSRPPAAVREEEEEEGGGGERECEREERERERERAREEEEDEDE
ncbi:hypothetical protein JAAARDRAFT_56762 [Jaapia argillacea MUCL 33604]|uniref:Fungal-type protein kinase domain-containing protein n=1 Tax=Jaapia argillacea MUCL 33604 TaxID=933084 RepID=A0A067Q0Y9_9AGAM|nr:hypothetical protein JAAARDRAFT_56762 [Jaapia argillacea MUCL 33604]